MDDLLNRERSGVAEQGSTRTWQSYAGSIAGYATAAIALVGALWFGLLSLGAAIVYAPLGVRPSEIGLSSGTVLAQSATTLIVLLIVYGVVAAVVYGVVAAAGAVGVPRVASLPRRSTRLAILAVTVALFAGTTIFDAVYVRHALEDGKAPPRPLPGLLSAWPGDVARLAWAHGQPSLDRALPACALYLGEAGGTSVVYDARAKETWRIPSSELIVTALPTQEECP